jgi:hypothetical protein
MSVINKQTAMTWTGLDIDKIFKDLKALERTEVLVGIPDANTDRPNGQPITNAALGYIHENGSAAANIPARPWLIPGILNEENKIVGYLRKGADGALNGNYNEAVRYMGFAGTTARDSAKAMINSNIQPALAASTLLARRRRGVTRTNTLIDTGAMRNSVNYIVSKK